MTPQPRTSSLVIILSTYEKSKEIESLPQTQILEYLYLCNLMVETFHILKLDWI